MVFFHKSKKSFFSPQLNQNLPLAAPPPGASASAIHHASTFRRAPFVWLVVALPSPSTPILLQLRLVLWPPPLVVPSLVRAFGVVCNSPLPRVAPLLFSWLSHIPAHQPLALRPSRSVGCCIPQRLSLSLSSPITLSVVVVERVHRQRGGDSFVVAVSTCVCRERGVSPAVALAARARRQGVAPRRERVRVDDVPVPGTPLELGQKASCVSQL
jgi:hypothetical protein